jgi:hypothetical protein
VTSLMDRRRAVWELAILLAAMLGHLWTDSRYLLPKPVRQLNTVLLATLALGILLRQRPSREDFGFAPRSWLDGVPLLAAGTGCGMLVLLGVGLMAGTVGSFQGLFAWQIENLHQQAFQQVLLQVLLVPRCCWLLSSKEGMPSNGWGPAVLAASIFALVHAPNVPLMIFSGLAGLGWVIWFQKHPNLPAVWISHALLAGTALATIHPFLGRLRVGIGYLWSSRDVLP